MLPTKFRFIWPSGFRGEYFFKNRPIRNKNCLWRPCLWMDRDEISNLYREPSIDASYQVSVHLAKGFQRRLKCEKLTDDRWQTPSDSKSSHCLWQGELKKIEIHVYIYYKCSFSILMHISVIQFRHLCRDNCILNTDIYI